MARSKRGRVTPPKATAKPDSNPGRSGPAAQPQRAGSTARLRLPDGSRSVRSPWVWRAFLFMALLALGLTVGLAASGRAVYAAAWAVITVGWLGISMWLWRQHLKDDSA